MEFNGTSTGANGNGDAEVRLDSSGSPFDNSEFESRLSGVLEQLRNLPLNDLILESSRLRTNLPLTEESKIRVKRSQVAGYCAYKMVYNLNAVRDANAKRLQIGKEIARLCDGYRSVPEGNRGVRFKLLAEINQQAAQQEVEFHRFALFATRVYALLNRAAKECGTGIDKDDREYLDSYRELRNHFEHVENLLLSETPLVEAVQESETELEWTITVAFPIDDQGRFVTKSGTADVSSSGLAKLVGIVTKYWQKMEDDCLGRLEAFFRNDPDRLPDSDDIGRQLTFVNDICDPPSVRAGIQAEPQIF